MIMQRPVKQSKCNQWSYHIIQPTMKGVTQRKSFLYVWGKKEVMDKEWIEYISTYYLQFSQTQDIRKPERKRSSHQPAVVQSLSEWCNKIA